MTTPFKAYSHYQCAHGRIERNTKDELLQSNACFQSLSIEISLFSLSSNFAIPFFFAVFGIRIRSGIHGGVYITLLFFRNHESRTEL